MTVMDITIHASFLPHNDPDASLAFYRDTLGFEVRNDVEYGGMQWVTVGPPTSLTRPSSCTPNCAEPSGDRSHDLHRRHREGARARRPRRRPRLRDGDTMSMATEVFGNG
jgi:catechol 2,3-dioxygenase-like lactoylglutathione lyase family enzyme